VYDVDLVFAAYMHNDSVRHIHRKTLVHWLKHFAGEHGDDIPCSILPAVKGEAAY
jgi:hypothetical protein